MSWEFLLIWNYSSRRTKIILKLLSPPLALCVPVSRNIEMRINVVSHFQPLETARECSLYQAERSLENTSAKTSQPPCLAPIDKYLLLPRQFPGK